MYVATQNYMSSNGMVRRGEEVVNPSKGHIARGLVKEVKIVKTEVTKNVDEPNVKRTRKPRK